MKNKDYVFFGLVIFCLILLVVLVWYMFGEGGQCLKNPYIYGASKMGNVQCSCTQNAIINPCPALFNFNDTSFNTPANNCGSSGSVPMQIEIEKFQFEK